MPHLRVSPTATVAVWLSSLLLALLVAGPVRADQVERCPSDQFFVHVPTWAPVTVPAGFRATFEAALRAHVTTRPQLVGTAVHVEPVFDTRSNVVERADGHERFWTIRTSPAIPSAELCRWLGALRNEAAALAGADLYVGRECHAAGLGSPGSPDWPLEVMGTPAPAAGPPATVVVVDSGFKITPDWAGPEAVGPLHPHGSMVAEAVEQLTVSVGVPNMLDFRVFGAEGTAPLSSIARALDSALFDAPRTEPRVINLSLGWPPEIERRRSIDGCAVLEDPAGEAVRYALAMAWLRDAGRLTANNGEAPNAPTAVVAAAGNRPVLFGSDVTPYYAAHHDVVGRPLVGDCSQPSGDGLFYPAQWARRRTCLEVGGGTVIIDRPLVTAVGATDHRDELSPLSGVEMSPLLVAPGVAVDLAGRRWTGSSVSAAYVSGAMALQMTGGLDAAAATAALYGAAQPLPASGSPLPVRRLAFPNSYTAGAPAASTGGPIIYDAGAPVDARDRLACLTTVSDWVAGTATPADVEADCPSFLTEVDRFSAGAAGPQPPTSGCPECLTFVYVAAEEGDMDVSLTDEWDPATTTFSDPFLVVSWPDGYESWVELADGPQWAPKETFTVKGLALTDRKTSTVADLVSKGSMSLVMKVEQGGKTWIDVSVVPMK